MKKTKLIALVILINVCAYAQINPTYIIPTPATSTNQTEFGTSFAIYEDWMIVAAPGSVNELLYAYKNVGGIWEFDHVIDNNDFDNAGLYGQSMEIEDGILVVGYPRDDQEWEEFEGHVHIFELENEQWNFVQEISAPDSTIFCNTDIGGKIQISEGNILVGTDIGIKPYGAVFSYYKLDGEWQLHQVIEPPITYGDSLIFGAFGATITVDGDQLIIGEIGNNDMEAFSGAAHYYKRIDGFWEYMDTVYEPDGTPSTSFGWDVYINMNDVIIGGFGFDTLTSGISNSSAGKAYYYIIENDELVFKQHLSNLFPTNGDRFGRWMYCNDDRLFIASTIPDLMIDGGGSHIMLYNKIGEYWQYQDQLILSDSQDPSFSNKLGYKMIVVNNTLIASAPQNDVDDVTGSGVIGVFEDLLVGVNELEEEEFSIQPNPAINEIQIGLPQHLINEAFQVRIFNLNGQLIHEGNKTSIRTLDISSLHQGFYILEIRNENWIARRKFLKS